MVNVWFGFSVFALENCGFSVLGSSAVCGFSISVFLDNDGEFSGFLSSAFYQEPDYGS